MMQRILFSLMLCSLMIPGRSQGNAEAEKLVTEGIALHDRGEYDRAIALYDKAIDLDGNYFLAWYEKTFSLYASGKKKECISISKDILKKFPDNPNLKHVYVQYGSSLDDIGKPGDAIEIYDKGIALFPGEYLLHFNKGLTLQKMEKHQEALTEYQSSLRIRPLHTSSNLYTAWLLHSTNKIPALLALATFLAVESNSDRSYEAIKRAEMILWGNVKKEGNNTTITMDVSALDAGKKKNKENNFSSAELIFALTAGTSKELDSLANTPAAKLSFRLQMLIGLLADDLKNNKGFYWEHYVPFFADMKEKKFVDVLAHLMYLKTGGAENEKWLEDNETAVEAFYDWLKAYKWPS